MLIYYIKVYQNLKKRYIYRPHNYTMKKIILITLLPLITLLLHANPKREVRAVWLTTIGGLDWPKTKAQSPLSAEKQKQELREILDKLQGANINTILFQTRIRGTVIYPSAYEPFDSNITGINGQAPVYDPLAFAIEECHKRGMELHAWVVCMPLGDVKRKKTLGKTFIANAQPSICKTYDGQLYLNPASEGARQHLARICREIASNYDVDGIHLDYIRYPDRPNSYPDEAEYRKSGKSMSKNNWRRNNITQTVRAIRNAVKGCKPWIKLSCSPIGKFDNLPRQNAHGWCSFTTVYQDAQGWLRDDLMDELYPMMYFQGENFYPFAYDWKENCCGRTIVAGLGIYMLHPSEKNWDLSTIEREMSVTRSIGIGHAMFRSKFFTDNTKGILDFSNRFYSTKALHPASPWIDSIPPTAPSFINLCNNGSTLLWGMGSDNMPQAGIRYNVYASSTYPVDTENADNLVATLVSGCSWDIPMELRGLNYAVRTIDRAGNESAPTATKEMVEKHEPSVLLRVENGSIKLPNNKNALLKITDIEGNVIKTITNKGSVNCKSLKCGMYVLRTFEKKGGSHIIGYFIL